MRRVAVTLAMLLGSGWAAASAAAQPPPPAAEDRPTLKIGPLEVRPRLVFSNIGFDNNVFNEPENPKRDFTATVSPDLTLSVRTGFLRLSYLSGTDLVYFRQYKEERSTSRRLAARADFDFPLVKPFVSYGAGNITGRPGNEVDRRVRHRPEVLSGGARFVISSRTSLLLSGQRSSIEYAPGVEFRGVELARTLNHSTTSYDTAFGFQATPLTSLSLIAGIENTSFAAAPERNSRSYRIAPSISISPLGLLTGTATVGFRHFEGRGGALPSYSGLYAGGGLGTVILDRYRVQTTFTRDIRYSYEETLPYYVQTAGTGSLATYLAAGFDVRIHGGVESMRYRAFDGSEPGQDRVTTYGAGVGYRIAERVTLVLTAEKARRQSTRDVIREYQNDRIFATLTWGGNIR